MIGPRISVPLYVLNSSLTLCATHREKGNNKMTINYHQKDGFNICPHLYEGIQIKLTNYVQI